MKNGVISEELARPSTFWLGLGALVAISVLVFRDATFTDLIGFFALAATAVLPAALWCWRRTHGLPIFPLFTLGTIGTFALPLIASHPLVMDYSPRERIMAAVAIAAANLAGTLPWYWITRRRSSFNRGRCFMLRRGPGHLAFVAILLVAIVFDLGQTELMTKLDPPVFSTLRAGVIALSNIAVFVLAYHMGGRRLSSIYRAFHGALIVAVMASTLPSALMVGALSYGVMALVGYALGHGRVPWFFLAALSASALFLQGGKEELRNKYWYSVEAGPISLVDYPGMMADWIRFSFDQAGVAREPSPVVTAPDQQSLIERASLLQLFLRIQQMSPDHVPYLHGRTYAIIPELLVPRALNEDKARAHLGTYLLAIHYDLQTTEDTLTTTIGFGLINEALANFGYPGCIALGLSLGIFYGIVSRWSLGYPLLSLRSVLAILVLSVSFQNEFSAGVYVTTLFQGTCVLLGLAPWWMVRANAPSTQPFTALTGAPV